MATPEELARLKGNPQTGGLDLPGVDPITLGSFQPNGPPDPGKQMQPEITLPDQVNGPELNPASPIAPQATVSPSLQVAGDAPSAFPGNPAPTPPTPKVPTPETKPYDPFQYAAANNNVFANQQQSNLDRAATESKGEVAKAEVYQNSVQKSNDELKQQVEAKAKIDAEVAQRDEVRRNQIAELRQMKVDPSRYWNKAGTFSNILSAISVGLGSFASGLTHGATGNPGLTLVNQAIENDMQAQKIDIENSFSAYEKELDLDKSQDYRSAKKLEFMENQRLAHLSLVQAQISEVEAKTRSEAVKFGAQSMNNELQLKINDTNKSLYDTLLAQKLAQQKAQAAAAGAALMHAKERNKSYEALRKQNLDAGMEINEAEAKAWKSTDEMYPQTARTQFASPGQKYEATVQDISSNLIKSNAAFNNKNPKAAEAARKHFINDQVKRGIPEDVAQAQYEQIKGIDSKEKLTAIVQSTVSKAGIADPYANKNPSVSQGTTEAIDPLSGQTVRVDAKNKPLAVRGPDDKVYLLPDASIANEWRKSQGLAENAKTATDTLARIAKEHPGGEIDALAANDKRDALEAVTALTAYYGAKANAGTMGEGDKKLYSQIVADPLKIFTLGDPKVQIQNMKNGIDNSSYATFKGYSGAKVTAPSAPKVEEGKTITPVEEMGGKPATPVEDIKPSTPDVPHF